MTGPYIKPGKVGGTPPPHEGASPTDQGSHSALERLVENLARVFDRLHPPNAPADGPLAGLSAQLRSVLAGTNADKQSNEAISALKTLLHTFESLRERVEYLNAASGQAYAQLNATEHRSHELSQQINRLWHLLANLPGMPTESKACLLDDSLDPERRLALAGKICAKLGTRPGDVMTEARVTVQVLRELAPIRERHQLELAEAKQVAEAVAAENDQLKERIATLEAKPTKPRAHEQEVRRLEANLAYEHEKSIAALAENHELRCQVAELQKRLEPQPNIPRVVTSPWRRSVS